MACCAPSTPLRDGTPRTHDLAWWHLARRTTTSVTIRITARLTIAFLVGLAAWHSAEPAAGPIGGATAGLIAALAGGDWTLHEPGFADLRLRNRCALLLHSLVTGLPQGLVLGLATGLVTGIAAGLAADLGRGLVTGLVFARRLAGNRTGEVDGMPQVALTSGPRSDS